MDRDDYFKILDDASCFNLENYFTDKEFSLMGALSNVQTEREEDIVNSLDKSDNFENLKKSGKKDKNALKMLE